MASGFPAPAGGAADRGRVVRRRPRDEAALFNPAFLGVLLSVASNEYERRRSQPLPYPLAFVVLPLVLASDVRSVLPRTTQAYFAKWVSNQPTVRVEMPIRSRATAPYAREAIRFGLRYGMLELVGARLRGSFRAPSAVRRFQGETVDIVRQAAFVGRWLAPEEPVQIFALFGMRP